MKEQAHDRDAPHPRSDRLRGRNTHDVLDRMCVVYAWAVGKGDPSCLGKRRKDMSEDPLKYMSDSEAKEFHKGFILSMGFFTFIAIVAHLLVWEWRPWFPGTEPYKAGLVMNSAPSADHTVTQLG
jgi:light-harvesting complex 1 beta chain